MTLSTHTYTNTHTCLEVLMRTYIQKRVTIELDIHINIPICSKSGQNGTLGQNGTPGVLEKPCQAWVYFQVNLIYVIGQFSAMSGNQTCNRPRF